MYNLKALFTKTISAADTKKPTHQEAAPTPTAALLSKLPTITNETPEKIFSQNSIHPFIDIPQEKHLSENNLPFVHTLWIEPLGVEPVEKLPKFTKNDLFQHQAYQTPLHTHGYTHGHSHESEGSQYPLFQQEKSLDTDFIKELILANNYYIYPVYNKFDNDTSTYIIPKSHPVIIYDVLNDIPSFSLNNFFEAYDATSENIKNLNLQLKQTCEKIELLRRQETTIQNFYNHAAELEHKLALEQKIKSTEAEITHMEKKLAQFLEGNQLISTYYEDFIDAKKHYQSEKAKHSALNYFFDYGDPTTWLHQAQIKVKKLQSALDNNSNTAEILMPKIIAAQEKVLELTKLVQLEDSMLAKKSLYQITLAEQEACIDKDLNTHAYTNLISEKTNELANIRAAHEVANRSLDIIDTIYEQVVNSLNSAESEFSALSNHLSNMGHVYDATDFPVEQQDFTYLAAAIPPYNNYIPPLTQETEIVE